MKRIVVAAILVLLLPPLARGEEINSIFKRVNEDVAAKKYSKALEDLGLARQEIEKLHLEGLKVYLPDTVAGYAAGPAQSSTALGVMSLERVYTKGPSLLKVAVRGGTTGGGMGSFGSIAQLGRMAAMMPNQTGHEKIDIGGRAAVVKRSGAKTEAMLFLESGWLVTLGGGPQTTSAEIESFGEALNVSALDAYLGAK